MANRPKQRDNQERVVLVSGGASGIGLAICKGFEGSNARVLCMDIDHAAAKVPHPTPFRQARLQGDEPIKRCRRAYKNRMHNLSKNCCLLRACI